MQAPPNSDPSGRVLEREPDSERVQRPMHDESPEGYNSIAITANSPAPEGECTTPSRPPTRSYNREARPRGLTGG